MFFGNRPKDHSGSSLVEMLKNAGEPARRPRKMVVAENPVAPAAKKTVQPTIRGEGLIQCPCCGLNQHADRTRCFDCGVYFSMGN